MTLESFKHIYKDLPLERKVILLCHQVELEDKNAQRAYECANSKNFEDAEYYRAEYHAMGDRIEWLYGEIEREIKNLKRFKALKRGNYGQKRNASISSVLPQRGNKSKAR